MISPFFLIYSVFLLFFFFKLLLLLQLHLLLLLLLPLLTALSICNCSLSFFLSSLPSAIYLILSLTFGFHRPYRMLYSRTYWHDSSCCPCACRQCSHRALPQNKEEARHCSSVYQVQASSSSRTQHLPLLYPTSISLN